MKTKKRFDCLAMKRAAQRLIRARVRGMTPDEEIAFFQAGHAEFRKAIAQARRGKKAERH